MRFCYLHDGWGPNGTLMRFPPIPFLPAGMPLKAFQIKHKGVWEASQIPSRCPRSFLTASRRLSHGKINHIPLQATWGWVWCMCPCARPSGAGRNIPRGWDNLDWRKKGYLIVLGQIRENRKRRFVLHGSFQVICHSWASISCPRRPWGRQPEVIRSHNELIPQKKCLRYVKNTYRDTQNPYSMQKWGFQSSRPESNIMHETEMNLECIKKYPVKDL